MDLVDMEAAREGPVDEALVAPEDEDPAAPDLAAPGRRWVGLTGLPWVAECITARLWGIGPHRPDPLWVAAGIARPGTAAAAVACCLLLA